MSYFSLHGDPLGLNGVMYHESGPVPYRLIVGVNNLQIFPAILTEESTAASREDYCLVNVLGLLRHVADTRDRGMRSPE